MGMHVDTSCINCGQAVGGTDQKYCPNCGQPTPAHRIDWHFLGHELEHSVLHMDRGILYSLKQLMLRPGKLLRDYIEGRRGNQVKPLLLIMVTAAAVVLLSRYFVGEAVLTGIAPPTNGNVIKGSGTDAAAMMASFNAAGVIVGAWVNAHFAAFTLMLLPIEASVKWLVFRRYSQLNYPEWLVVTALLTVQVFILWMIVMLLHRWLPDTQVWAGVLGVVYGTVSLVQFFQGRPIWSTVWRALLAYLVFALIGQLAVGAAVLGLMLLR